MIRDFITMTSKGTFTLPVRIRRLLGIMAQGDFLAIQYDPSTQQAILSKPKDFRALQEKTAKYLKRKRKPLTDVSSFYQAERGKDLE